MTEPERHEGNSNADPEPAKPRLICSLRVSVAFVCMLAVFNVSWIRIGLPLSIVCMTTPPYGSHETHGEFNWSSTVKGYLISAAFYGFILGPLVAGFLSFRYGAKKVLVLSSVTSGASNLFVPVGARTSSVLFFAIRTVTGFFGSFTFPAFYDLLSHWAVPEERQLLIGGALIGIPLASILNFPIDTLICDFCGWVWIFYSFGLWLVLCGLLYLFTVYDYPEKCPYITAKELNYLKNRIPKPGALTIPWKHISRSLPVYAYVIMHLSINYVYLSMIMSLPLLMEEVYHLSLEENGVLSSTPFIGSFIMRILISLFFEHLRQRLNLSKNAMRKIFISIGTTFVTLCLLTATLLPRSQSYWVLACFVGASSSLELCVTGGYLLSVLDLCPSYVNVVTGIANSVGNVAGLVSPVINGWITVYGTKQEWDIVFYVTISVLLVATTFYLVFGENHQQHWGRSAQAVQPPHRPSLVH